MFSSIAVLAFISAVFCLLLCIVLKSGGIKEIEVLRITGFLDWVQCPEF
jgi:hypothetical protein